jgi:hypothetical protein
MIEEGWKRRGAWKRLTEKEMTELVPRALSVRDAVRRLLRRTVEG